MPLIVFSFHIHTVLQAIHCQTSPHFSVIKYGMPEQEASVDFAGNGGFLYHLSSALLLWRKEEHSCRALGIDFAKDNVPTLNGTVSLLWPIFQSLCISQFIETLSCAVSGRTVKTETGMSIFEHSLAFAEAEAMVRNQLSKAAPDSLMLRNTLGINGTLGDSESLAALYDVLTPKLNAPPEVLLMVFISCLNNFTSHLLGVFDMQAKFRLVNTGVWALCFMFSFLWSLFSFSLGDGNDAGIFRFPTVCIVGFIPHLLILLGIIICAIIYAIALLLTAASPPRDTPHAENWKERFQLAQDNLQINSSLQNMRLNMQEDFYTALLRIGFSTLTAASDAVYLNEGRRISVQRWTWLEEQRMDELELNSEFLFSEPTQPATHIGEYQPAHSRAKSKSEAITNTITHLSSGYGRERTTKTLRKSQFGNSKYASDGVGAFQRGGRYIHAWDFLVGIFSLAIGWTALGLQKFLTHLGVRRTPAWVLGLIREVRAPSISKRAEKGGEQPIDFWILSDDGVLSLPENNNVDVELETKKRQKLGSSTWDEAEEQGLDNTLYQWWSHGGWWGERDGSGEYVDTSRDEDTTSVISTAYSDSLATSDDEWELREGNRTPTQQHFSPSTQEAASLSDLTLEPSQLAALLNPQDEEHRTEARILAHHLQSDHIVTRSQHRAYRFLDKARMLTAGSIRPPSNRLARPSGKLNPTEEAELLEHIILTRRTQASQARSTGSLDNDTRNTWHSGAEGLGSGGPQCVVCQCAPRVILAWPCRCLSLCEDCRVSLAMNNFGTCVCCRGEVVGFSRLFVP